MDNIQELINVVIDSDYREDEYIGDVDKWIREGENT